MCNVNVPSIYIYILVIELNSLLFEHKFFHFNKQTNKHTNKKHNPLVAMLTGKRFQRYTINDKNKAKIDFFSYFHFSYGTQWVFSSQMVIIIIIMV